MSSIFVCDGDSPRLLGLEKAPPPLTIMSSWLTAPLLRDSSEEKWGLFTNRKLGMSWAALLFLRLLVLFRVSVIVPVILSLQKQTFNKKNNLNYHYLRVYLIFLVFFLDMFITEITPVTSSSSEMMKPLPTSDEKYMKVFFPVSVTVRCMNHELFLEMSEPTFPIVPHAAHRRHGVCSAQASAATAPHQSEGSVCQRPGLQGVTVPSMNGLYIY